MKIQLSGNGGTLVSASKMCALAIVFAGAFTSCKKEVVSSEIPAESTAVTAETFSNATAATTNFGALLSGNTTIDDEITVCEKLGVKYVRYAIKIKDFNGTDKGYEKWVDAGYKVLLNLNYDNVTNSNGKKKAVPFPTDMVEYKKLLEKVLDKYHPEIAVIENEPTTDAFHSGPIEDYITELRTAVDVCTKRGIAVADGGLHIDYVGQVKTGWGLQGNALETKKLIDAYKTMKLTYVNTHVKSPFNNSSKYPSGELEGDADYLRSQTGKPVICNEYNQQSSSTTLMTGTVGGFENGQFKYVICRSGSGTDKGEALNNGTSLTPLGNAYRDAIK